MTDIAGRTDPERLMKLADVAELMGVSVARVREWIANHDDFPKGKKYGWYNYLLWKRSDIVAYINAVDAETEEAGA